MGKIWWLEFTKFVCWFVVVFAGLISIFCCMQYGFADWRFLVPLIIAIVFGICTFFLNGAIEREDDYAYKLLVEKEHKELDNFKTIEPIGTSVEEIEANNACYTLILRQVKSMGFGNNICPSCGSPINGEYCQHCGRKIVDYDKCLVYQLYGSKKEYHFVNEKLVDVVLKKD